MTLRIGVLGIQGGFQEHLDMVKAIGCEAVDVRRRDQLGDLDGLILPGGESTTIGLVARDNDLIEPIRDFIHKDKKPVLGTCAGLIVLSDRVTHEKEGGQALFGGLSTVVARNGFGRQVNSFEHALNIAEGVDVKPVDPAVFIRAPIVVQAEPSVKVLATLVHSFKDYCDPNANEQRAADNVDVIVGVQQDHIVGLSFHPELTDDTCWHQYFKTLVQECKNKRTA
ncbi:hypothetical protein DIPPA_56949 [Diplonema papillatum]|nr:hypothetical protein DIPPA_56949 [Diplonema papillatum]|eukprot:gene2587-4008_t